MRIFFLAGSFNQGGAEYQLLALANIMQQKGHIVHVLAITDYPFYKDYLKQRNISFECLSNGDSYLKRIWLVSRKFRSFRPDAIISFMKVPGMVAVAGKLMSGVNACLLLGERTALVKPVRDFFHFNAWRFADVITTNAVSKIDYFKRNFPSFSKKLTLVSNIYEKQLMDFSFERVKMPVEDEPINLVFVGRVAPEKNLLVLLQALHSLKEGNQRFRLSIYGDTRHKNYYEELVDYIQSNNLDDIVAFKGPVSAADLKNVYLQTDLLCLLSEYEGFSNVLAESLIHGCIILSSNIPENAAVIKDGENGFLVSTKDFHSVESGLVRFFSLTQEDKAIMRKRNFDKARVLFDQEKVYQTYLALLQQH